MYRMTWFISFSKLSRFHSMINNEKRRNPGLEWDKHIDIKHGFILLDQTKNGERREMPINGTVRDVLTRLMRRLDSPYVFMDS
jgi:hypothetical protein